MSMMLGMRSNKTPISN